MTAHRLKPPLTVGSLFSGIGGLELGLERAGIRVVWQVETDDYCRRVLAKHWPDVKRYKDVRTIEAGELEPVDVVCGGFPCQPVSVVGQRKGDTDDRWLWPEMRRVCEMVKPRWVLAENVPGLLSASSGRLFGEVVRDLAALGYHVEWDCVSAASVGAPHFRNRIFLVGSTVNMEHAMRKGLQGVHDEGRRVHLQPATGDISGNIWRTTPEVYRRGDGIPARVDRTRALGNAVVPAVAEFVGRMIVEQRP